MMLMLDMMWNVTLDRSALYVRTSTHGIAMRNRAEQQSETSVDMLRHVQSMHACMHACMHRGTHMHIQYNRRCTRRKREQK